MTIVSATKAFVILPNLNWYAVGGSSMLPCGLMTRPSSKGRDVKWPLFSVKLYKTPVPAPSIVAPKRRSGSTPSF